MGSICIGVLLVVVAVLVGIEVKSLLIGQSVEQRVLQRMREHIAAEGDVETVYNLLTQQLGRDVMVAVKAKMRPAESARALVESINRVEQSFRAAFPQVRWLFFEPDIAD
jgi:divalent metal cation (Fe/Co/Zn/Cd) transporter